MSLNSRHIEGRACWRRPWHAARRVGCWCLLALVHLSVLLALAPFSVEFAEPEAEIAETLQIDWLGLPESLRSHTKVLQLRRLPRSAMRPPRDAHHAAGHPAHSFVARAAGHRLANGLLAPLQC